MLRPKHDRNANIRTEDPLVPSSNKLGEKISTMNVISN